MSKKKNGLKRKQKQMNCFIKIKKHSGKAQASGADFPIVDMPIIQESFAPRTVETIPVIDAPTANKIKFPLWKKYKAPSIVVLCLTLVLTVFQNCVGGGGDGGGGSTASNSVNQPVPIDLASIAGEYFLSMPDNRIVYLRLNGYRASMEFQQITNGHALIQENDGDIVPINNNEFKIEYTKETCNPIQEEIIKIKKGSTLETLEITTVSGKEYIFSDTSKVSLPVWATTVTTENEDISCSKSFLDFKTTKTSNAINSATKQIRCKNGVRKNNFEQVFASSLNFPTLTKGVRGGDADSIVYLGYSIYGDVIGINQIYNSNNEILAYNVEFSFCIDTLAINTPTSFQDRNITSITATNVMGLADNGSVNAPGIRITLGNYNDYASFNRSFGDLDSVSFAIVDPASFAVPEVASSGVATSGGTASWSSPPSEFDINRYQYCIGTSATTCNVVSWRSNGISTSLNLGSLNLASGQTYFLNVLAIDGQENISSINSSTFFVDTVPPNPVSGLAVNSNITKSTSQTPLVTWANSTSNDVARYEYSIGTSTGSTNILNWVDIGLVNSVTKTDLSLSFGTYYVNVRAIDTVGNISSVRSSSWIVTPWESLTMTNAPSSRSLHSMVWTGSEMIVWGGFNQGVGVVSNIGAKYNPTTNLWTTISSTNAPSARSHHTAVWTGSEMIIWGGSSTNTGAKYNPTTNTWTTISTANAPSARSAHSAVWTGTDMIIWGGTSTNTGAKYNPTANTWTPISTTNTPSIRSNHVAIWTGSEMIIWGGNSTNTGAKYNPATDSWSPISTTNRHEGELGYSVVWTGNEMIVWGGTRNNIYGYDPRVNTGAKYNPVTNSWTTLSGFGSNAPQARHGHSAVWTGTEMIVWGGNVIVWNGGIAGDAYTNSGARYNPQTNSWTNLSTNLNAPSARYNHNSIWSGSEIIIWGGGNNLNEINNFTSGGKMAP